MDGQLWAKRTTSKCVRGMRENLGRKFIFTNFRNGEFDFDPSEVEKASATKVIETRNPR